MMEKEIKSSVEKITMPDDVKKRIINKCAEIERTGANDNADYTDHVFGVERVRSHNIRRIVCGIAACAVIAGGIGTTSVLLKRQGNSQIGSEVTDEMCNKISPFGDFSSHEFNFYISYENVNYDYNAKASGTYSDETYAKLAKLLNNTEWTDGADINDPETKEKVYEIFWNDDTILNILLVSDSGYVIHQVIDQSDINDQQEMAKAYYSINFDEFESAVQEILASDTTVVDDELPFIRDELQQLITDSIDNDSIKAHISYNTENITDIDVPESIKKDNSEIPADMLIKLASWMDGNAVQLCNGPRRSNVLFYIEFKKNGKETAAVNFMKEGFFTYQTFDTETGEETNYYCFKADSEDAFKAMTDANYISKSDFDTDIRSEMIQKLTAPVYDKNWKAVYGVNDKDIADLSEIRTTDLTDAMIFGLADWIDRNQTDISDLYPDTGKLLFYVDIYDSNAYENSFRINFYENNIYCYNFTDDGTTYSYDFKGNCRDALSIIQSAADTEIKHTEDNAAYYLPGFNFEKIGITGDPEKDSALQDIFYGYDWAAHEVDELQVYGETPDYIFYYTTSVENVNCKYNLGVYRNGYIHLYYTDMNNNPIHPDKEKIYKFDNDNIYKALYYYYSNNSITPDFSDESEFYSYADGKDISPEDFRFDNSADLTYTFLDTNKSGTFTENEKLMILEILEFSFDMENELPDKEYSGKFGEIGLGISDVSHEDGSPFETTVHITDKNYMIISANDGNHIYKAREGADNIQELVRGFIDPTNGASININTQD